MTDGTRILRTVGIPLGVAIIFLIIVPKTCEKALTSGKLRLPQKPSAPPTDTGLHIHSVSPDAPSSKPLMFPNGLDPQRIQYLVEIDPRFNGSMIIRIAKPGGVTTDPVSAQAFVQAGWLETSGDGFNPTREGTVHFTGMTEEPLAWLVPVGTRKFGRVTSLDDAGDGKVRIGFTWQWEPNEAGRSLKASEYELHRGAAEFAGGGEHPWDLTNVEVDSEWR